MPGISLIYDVSLSGLPDKTKITKAIHSLRIEKDYCQQVLLDNERAFLSFTGYVGYPIKLIENNLAKIFIEGYIYNKNDADLRSELENLSNELKKTNNIFRDKVKSWLMNTDGDFVLVFAYKYSKNIVILNDAFGRLPLYYCYTNGRFFLSRELRFITSLAGRIEVDEMAFAQYLLFEYPLGHRTLFRNTYRLEAGSVLHVYPQQTAPKPKNLNRFDFQVKRYENRGLNHNALRLAELFLKACQNRAASNAPNVLSLSGGLDSRSVAAGLQKSGIPFVSRTFLDANKTALSDIPVAQKLARLFELDWKICQLPRSTGRQAKKLLDMKSGLNSLSMSFILHFFDTLRKEFGRDIFYLTGDGGDKVLPNLNPPIRIKGLDQLTKYILDKNQIFPLYITAALTGLPEKEIENELKLHLSSYPEDDWNDKYIHFLIYERAMKWLFEGEDRNRYFFWSTTPFYSIGFFDYAMNCPNDQKSGYLLYRHFLHSLSPALVDLPDSNSGLCINSYLFRLRQMGFSFAKRYPAFFKRLKKNISKESTYRKNSTVVTLIREQLDSCELIKNYLSCAAITQLLEKPERYSKNALNNLFTLTCLVESLSNKNIALDKMPDCEIA
jgi:asparagine synthase (glutamine-hydrolysing)